MEEDEEISRQGGNEKQKKGDASFDFQRVCVEKERKRETGKSRKKSGGSKKKDQNQRNPN